MLLVDKVSFACKLAILFVANCSSIFSITVQRVMMFTDFVLTRAQQLRKGNDMRGNIMCRKDICLKFPFTICRKGNMKLFYASSKNESVLGYGLGERNII